MATKQPLTAYQWKLFAFLSVATFFEGYDLMALSQILPHLAAEFGLDKLGISALMSVISVGTVAAYFLVRKADHWGRRRVLMVTIVGYTVFSFLTAFSPNAWIFAALQLVANLFLVGEWAISMVYAAEEFPADRRGTIIGVIQAIASLGAIACTIVVPPLLRLEYGWRSVYVVGTVPLVLMAFARRGIRETRRFEEQVRGAGPAPLLRIWRTPSRRRVAQLGLIWGLTYMCNKSAVAFWPLFATAERGFTPEQVRDCIGTATLVALPLAFFAGKLIDVAGRKGGGAIVFLTAAIATACAYTLHSPFALTLSLIGGVFASTAVMPVLNAYTSELFPTELRSDGFAWSNNLLGRLAYVVSPIVVGQVAIAVGWGPAVASTAVFPVLALVLIVTLLPETRGLELEAIAPSAPAAPPPNAGRVARSGGT